MLLGVIHAVLTPPGEPGEVKTAPSVDYLPQSASLSLQYIPQQSRQTTCPQRLRAPFLDRNKLLRVIVCHSPKFSLVREIILFFLFLYT